MSVSVFVSGDLAVLGLLFVSPFFGVQLRLHTPLWLELFSGKVGLFRMLLLPVTVWVKPHVILGIDVGSVEVVCLGVHLV